MEERPRQGNGDAHHTPLQGSGKAPDGARRRNYEEAEDGVVIVRAQRRVGGVQVRRRSGLTGERR